MEEAVVFVVAKVVVEGVHRWPECPFEDVAFLKCPHRHQFHIQVVKEVEHEDRDIEIIRLQRAVKDYLAKKFYSTKYNCLDFETMSCESIARLLCEEFECYQVKVLEDNENGAVVRNLL